MKNILTHFEMKTFLKQMALTLICVIATTNYLYGQSTAPDELTLKWHESQRGKIQDVVLSRLQQKPEFLADYLFSDPDYRLYIPKVEPWVLGDMYNDHILVFDTPRNDKLFAVWVQASIEAALDQHTAFSRSFDRGRTWETPRVIAGNSTIREGLDNNGAIGSCAFPLVSKSGRIYIIYSQHSP